MRAKLKAKITEVKNSDGTSSIGFYVPNAGKVETRAVPAQDVYMDGHIQLKSLIANEMKIGATITITISDEEPDDRLS